MVRSSVALHLTPGVAAGLVLLPLAYLAAVLASNRVRPLARPIHLGRLALSADPARGLGGRGPVRLRAGVDDAPGSPHRRERALGAGVVGGAGGGARRQRAAVERLRRRRPRRLRASGVAPGPRRTPGAVRGARGPRQDAAAIGTAQRHRGRARSGGGALDQPGQRAVRHHADADGRIRPRARVRQLLRAHRAQLQLAGGDAAVHLSQARFPGRDRGIPGARRHVARGAVPGARLPHLVRDAERPAVGGMAAVHRRARLRPRPRLSRPRLRRTGVVVGRRGSLHGGRSDRPPRPGPRRPVLHDGVEPADAPPVRAVAGHRGRWRWCGNRSATATTSAAI